MKRAERAEEKISSVWGVGGVGDVIREEYMVRVNLKGERLNKREYLQHVTCAMGMRLLVFLPYEKQDRTLLEN